VEQARTALIGNLAQNAKTARGRQALSLEAVSTLTRLPLANLTAVEHGEREVDLTLDQLISLALFLGLTANGTFRPKPAGSG
jgi:hypothetical protein